MGITVRWEDETKTTLYWVFEGRWEWQAFNEAANYAMSLRDSAPYRQAVNFIINTTTASPIQTGSLPLHNTPVVDLVDPFNGDKVFLVGRIAFNRKLMSVMRRMNVNMGETLQYANTMDEARFMLRER